MKRTLIPWISLGLTATRHSHVLPVSVIPRQRTPLLHYFRRAPTIGRWQRLSENQTQVHPALFSDAAGKEPSHSFADTRWHALCSAEHVFVSRYAEMPY